jgi:anti-sigma factor RsiW
MSVSDSELEQLEAYLDGELPADEEEALRGRIEADAALSAALEALTAERSVRASAYRSFEPTDAVTRRVVMRVEAAVDRQRVWSRRLSKLRIASAAAACILLGFLIGRTDRGAGTAQPDLFVRSGTQQNPAISPQPGRGVAAPAGPTVVSLPIRDQHGNVLGYQKFDSPQRANEFIEDITRLQQRQQQQLQNGNLTYTSDGKF